MTATHSINSKYAVLVTISILCFAYLKAQQKTIQLYKGPAPGSESWNWDEKTFFVKTPLNANVAYNISKPTLTVFTPDSANGVAVVICPGGNFHVLSVENDGINVAKQLNRKGITAFLLKHRLLQSLTNNPWEEMRKSMMDTAENRKKITPARELAFADATKAIEYIRQHAAEFNIDPNKVGVIGFSGGGSLAMHLVLKEKPDLRPNFVGLIYTLFKPEYSTVSPNAPPAFIACATDDTKAISTNSIQLYTTWKAANIPVELHIYSKGEHGLMTPPANSWISRFTEWLTSLGF